MKEGGGDGQVWEQDKSSLGCKRMYKYCKLGRRCDARQAQQLWEQFSRRKNRMKRKGKGRDHETLNFKLGIRVH